MREQLQLFKEAWSEFNRDKAQRLAAGRQSDPIRPPDVIGDQFRPCADRQVPDFSGDGIRATQRGKVE